MLRALCLSFLGELCVSPGKDFFIEIFMEVQTKCQVIRFLKPRDKS